MFRREDDSKRLANDLDAVNFDDLSNQLGQGAALSLFSRRRQVANWQHAKRDKIQPLRLQNGRDQATCYRIIRDDNRPTSRSGIYGGGQYSEEESIYLPELAAPKTRPMHESILT